MRGPAINCDGMAAWVRHKWNGYESLQFVPPGHGGHSYQFLQVALEIRMLGLFNLADHGTETYVNCGIVGWLNHDILSLHLPNTTSYPIR